MIDAEFTELKGKVITSIDGLSKGSESARFICSDGSMYRLHYYQDCCARCDIEDIFGDVADLLKTEILQAELVQSHENPEGVKTEEYQESFTWSFYKLATIKGSVTIRWYGSSNGYYSETATFEREK